MTENKPRIPKWQQEAEQASARRFANYTDDQLEQALDLLEDRRDHDEPAAVVNSDRISFELNRRRRNAR